MDKVRRVQAMRMIIGGIGLWVAAGLVACGPDASSARGAVERFLDTHYVRIDVAGAQPLTYGVARQKVEKELELTRGVAIDETTRTPSISYVLVDETPSDDGSVRFLYEATITPPDAESFRRRWLVLARQVEGVWKVSNYEELPE